MRFDKKFENQLLVPPFSSIYSVCLVNCRKYEAPHCAVFFIFLGNGGDGLRIWSLGKDT
jgi:hypothetical protein